MYSSSPSGLSLSAIYMCLVFQWCLRLKLPVVYRIRLQSKKLSTCMENNANGDLKFNNSPVLSLVVPLFNRFHIKKIWTNILADILFFFWKLLVANGASLYEENRDGETACDCAIKRGFNSIASFLESRMVFSVSTFICIVLLTADSSAYHET